ncbi:MAG: VWA domain-containing protein [Deltaproteobacteria bacterium]|nr:VWA domain-containing protein [Deltaproteobacteria bacterium]
MGKSAQVWGVTGLLASLGLGCAACVGETPASDLAPPDPGQVLVFFPIAGTVYGRGAGGSVTDPRAKYVCIREPFASYSDCSAAIEADGSFAFRIRAVSGDVLEIACAEDPAGKIRGAFGFVRVPGTPSPRPAQACCKSGNQTTGICQQRQSVLEGEACQSPIPGLTRACQTDRECAADAHETLNFDANSVQITAPNQQGIVTVTGKARERTLVRLENRGQRSVLIHGEPGRNPGQVVAMIADDEGNFRFDRILARGQDELVIQFMTLNDDRSPEGSFIVPNPSLEGLDIISVENFEALTENEVGTVAVRIAPYGLDRYGLCPPSAASPQLCFGGGLDHSMVTFTRATIDAIASPPTPTPTDENLEFNRGTQGDPLGGPLTIVMVVDLSAKAATLDPSNKRITAARNFVAKRTRDRIGAIGYGPTTPLRFQPVAFTERATVFDGLAAATPGGKPSVFEGIKLAGEMLNAANAYENGRIVVMPLDNPVDDSGKTVAEAFEDAWNVVGENPDTGFAGFPVYVLPASLPTPHTYLGDIASFTGGSMYSGAACAAQLEQTLSRLAADMFGSFVLLYDLRVPDGRGKSARIDLGLELSLRDNEDRIQTMTASYEGPLVIANATGAEVPICP